MSFLKCVEKDAEVVWTALKTAGHGTDALKISLQAADTLLKLWMPSLPVPTVQQELGLIKDLQDKKPFFTVIGDFIGALTAPKASPGVVSLPPMNGDPAPAAAPAPEAAPAKA